MSFTTLDYIVCADPGPFAPALYAGSGNLTVDPVTAGSSPGPCTALAVQNVGLAPATGVAITGFSGSDPTRFEACVAASNPCGASLAAGASCNLGVRVVADANGLFLATAQVEADGGVTASRPLIGEASGFGIPPGDGYESTDSATGHKMFVVPIPTNRTISTISDYHATCQEYGLSAYDTSDSNSACAGTNGYPLRVGSCNMGVFNQAGYDYRFNEPVPALSRVYWIAVTSNAPTIGMEWNAVGPCSASEQIGACGTGSLNGNGNGIRHSKNPIYSANYNVINVAMTTDDFIVCTEPD